MGALKMLVYLKPVYCEPLLFGRHGEWIWVVGSDSLRHIVKPTSNVGTDQVENTF